MPTHPRASLAFSPVAGASYDFRGFVGDRLAANLDGWLLVAPRSNPAMLDMFRDRDRLPRRDLLPWSGEFAGKYLTSAVLAWRLNHDARLEAHLAAFVDELIGVQGDDGYLGPFPRSERLTGKTLDGNYALWDLWGHYHCTLGLLLYYKETGYQPALVACRRAADYVCAAFLDTGRRVSEAGAEEMNMAAAHGLCLLYQETGEPRYLRMAREIEADWQAPPAGDYVRTALAGRPFYQTPKPRWESLHDVQAILALYEITGEPQYRQAFEHIWRTIVQHDRHNTGGFSSGERATGNPYDPAAIETCCTIAWMAVTVDMLRLSGDPTVADELELSTFNAVLGAQSPSGRWWTYNTPMDGARRASAHDIVFQARAGSPELNCCSVNGPRGLGMLSEWAVMSAADGPALNYYGPAAFAVPLPSGQPLRLVQDTTYPVDGRVRLSLGLAQPERFVLRLRVPGWSRQTAALLNGEALAPVAGQYLALDRTWQDGDRIDLDLDMSLRAWHGAREAAGKASLYRGPLLLAYDRRFNGFDPDAARLPDIARAPEPVAWKGGGPEPWLLLRFPAADGRDLHLCDFATAGMTGAPYLTWLPAA